ncbi:hypothetical protein AAC387_Pa03g0245 [Persea americana]
MPPTQYTMSKDEKDVFLFVLKGVNVLDGWALDEDLGGAWEIGAIVWFLDLFDYYVNNDDQEVFSKELQLDAKVLYFDIGENKRGGFLKIVSAKG